MVEAFGSSGLGDFAAAATAAEIVAAARPSSSIYIQLASFAYAGGDARTGDLAAAKAVSLAPAAQRATLKTELASLKAQALKQAAGAAAAPALRPGHPPPPPPPPPPPKHPHRRTTAPGGKAAPAPSPPPPPPGR